MPFEVSPDEVDWWFEKRKPTPEQRLAGYDSLKDIGTGKLLFQKWTEQNNTGDNNDDDNSEAKFETEEEEHVASRREGFYWSKNLNRYVCDKNTRDDVLSKAKAKPKTKDKRKQKDDVYFSKNENQYIRGKKSRHDVLGKHKAKPKAKRKTKVKGKRKIEEKRVVKDENKDNNKGQSPSLVWNSGNFDLTSMNNIDNLFIDDNTKISFGYNNGLGNEHMIVGVNQNNDDIEMGNNETFIDIGYTGDKSDEAAALTVDSAIRTSFVFMSCF